MQACREAFASRTQPGGKAGSPAYSHSLQLSWFVLAALFRRAHSAQPEDEGPQRPRRHAWGGMQRPRETRHTVSRRAGSRHGQARGAPRRQAATAITPSRAARASRPALARATLALTSKASPLSSYLPQSPWEDAEDSHTFRASSALKRVSGEREKADESCRDTLWLAALRRIPSLCGPRRQSGAQ